jgi:hypothetical protein
MSVSESEISMTRLRTMIWLRTREELDTCWFDVGCCKYVIRLHVYNGSLSYLVGLFMDSRRLCLLVPHWLLQVH